MQRLAAEVEHDHAQQQPRQRLRQPQQRPPRDQHQQQRANADPMHEAAVHPVPDPRRHQRTGHPGQTERTDGRRRPVQRWCRQRQGCRRPEHIEPGKQQQGQRTALAQGWVTAQHAQHRAQQLAPTRRHRRYRHGRQAPPQQHGQRRHHRSRQQIDRLPAGNGRHAAGQHPRQQQPDEHPTLHRAHHAPALRGRCHRRRAGDQALGQRGPQQPDQQHARQQPTGRACRRQPQQRGHQCRQLHAQQAPPVPSISQRQHAQQCQHTAGLGSRQHGTGCRPLQRERLCQPIQQWLRVIDIGDAGTGGHREQDQQGAWNRHGIHGLVAY